MASNNHDPFNQTFHPTGHGDELLPGAMYFRVLPDKSKDWFSVVGKKITAQGQVEYAIISTTYGRQHLKDTAVNYKVLIAGCTRWDTRNQCAWGEDVEEDIVVGAVSLDENDFTLEI